MVNTIYATENAPTTLALLKNEPVRNYAPGSAERRALKVALKKISNEQIDLPMFIGGKEVRVTNTHPCVMPHDHGHVLGLTHIGGAAEVHAAIAAAGTAHPSWSRTSPNERAAIFLKAADLLAGPWRDRLNAATMAGQSKTVHQAEIDSAAELIDFLRFNVTFMRKIHDDQPISPPDARNRVDYRPLEGFIFATTPFNFTAIAGNLPSAPALMGNTVVWKPALTASYSAHVFMQLLMEAGLPDGVINLVHGNAPQVANIALSDGGLAGVHFTGSTAVFNGVVRKVGESAGMYRGYPRIVGETGGKNFVIAHASADIDALATAIIRGGFEYQGQKCSAASRVFVPKGIWLKLKHRLCDEIATIHVGDIADFSNFMGAVIDEKSWTKQAGAFERARRLNGATVLKGALASKKVGYFVQPTLIETNDPTSFLMQEEFFGPIVSVYVYPDGQFAETLKLIDRTSAYGLTGAVFARDDDAVREALDTLRDTAGNFYINDKPTGAVVGQQPFGGARASGTNDKAGSMWNLARWVSPRTIKQTFAPATDYRYPFMAAR